MKKLLSLLLAIVMVAGIVALLPVYADEAEETVNYNDGTWTAISTVDEFLAMNTDGKYYLTGDLDFGGKLYDGYVYQNSGFSGIFDGCGYSILNVKMEGRNTAIFNRNFHGTIQNVTFGTAETPITAVGTNYGGDACIVTASIEHGDYATYKNVTVYADIKATGVSGGVSYRASVFCGWSDGNVTTLFENCHVYGSIEAQPAAGFMVTNANTTTNVTFKNCSNNAAVYCATDRSETTAGFYAASWEGGGNHNATLTFENCVNNGAITSGNGGDRNSAGGFVCLRSNVNLKLTMDNCVNNGKITSTNGCCAGLLAFRKDGAPSETLSIAIANSVNYGDITSTASAAGIYCGVSKDQNVTFTIKNSANFGNITGGGSPTGGIYSTVSDGDSTDKTVTASIIGCFNAGNVTSTGWRAGGIVGLTTEAKTTDFTIAYCYNTGAVTCNNGGGSAAGISGETDQTGGDRNTNTTITNCYNVGEITNSGNGDRQLAIAWRERSDSSNAGYLTVKNNFFTNDLTAANGNFNNERFTVTNTVKVEASELLAKLTEVAIADSDVQFVADVYGVNGGNPILSWQIPANANAPKFDEGSLEGGVVSTTGITGYVSAREGEKAGTCDLRFILAVDLEAAKGYETVDVTIEFCDVLGVVKSFTLGFDDLDFYLTATAAGETYTAAEGDALFGAVVKGVPNTAWDYVVVSVATSADAKVAGVATTAVLPEGLPVLYKEINLTEEGIFYSDGITKNDNGSLGWFNGERYVEFSLYGNYEGTYALTLGLECHGRRMRVVVNGVHYAVRSDEAEISEVTLYVEMQNGENIIRFQALKDNAPNLLSATLTKVTIADAGEATEEIKAPTEKVDAELNSLGWSYIGNVNIDSLNNNGASIDDKRIGNTNNDNFAIYTYENLAAGTYRVTVTYLSQDTNRCLSLRVNDANTTAKLIPGNGSWDNVANATTCELLITVEESGKTSIRFGGMSWFDEGSGPNILSFHLTPVSVTEV